MIQINKNVAIPEDELRFTVSLSGGPGGQNVNKLSTRVSLRFDVAGSCCLSADEKELVQRRLGTRMSKAGVLRVVSQRFRSQAANRRAAVERFAELLREALRRPRVRVPTKPPAAAKRRRLEEKRRRSRVKQLRSERPTPEDWV